MARRSKPAPWYHDFRKRLRFEAEAAKANGAPRGRKIGKGKHAEIVYVVAMTVPEYEERRKLTIRLRNGTEPSLIAVTVDGPTESPHRYGERDLCMWRPGAPGDARWTSDEGLLRLIQYATVHLYREEYWRETGGRNGGVWLGDEAPHGDVKERAA
jgi:hypothetical protein